MSKIIHEHVPASELPERLRRGIDVSATVTVTIQEEPDRREALTSEQLKNLIEDAQRNAKGITTEEAVTRIRKLRDEWDE